MLHLGSRVLFCKLDLVPKPVVGAIGTAPYMGARVGLSVLRGELAASVDSPSGRVATPYARTKTVIDRTMAATMTPAVTSPAGVVRTVAFSATFLPMRRSTLALISSGCTGALSA